MTFDDAVAQLEGIEGGFTLDPRDGGNWTGGAVGKGVCRGTKFGISAARYPGEDIEHLTLERAKELYRRDFWGPAGCDAMPHELRFDLFETAVNTGHPQAIKFLQRAIGEHDDGILGARTLQSVLSVNPVRVLARFEGWRLDYLNDNPVKWAAFGRGWAQRIADRLKVA